MTHKSPVNPDLLSVPIIKSHDERRKSATRGTKFQSEVVKEENIYEQENMGDNPYLTGKPVVNTQIFNHKNSLQQNSFNFSGVKDVKLDGSLCNPID